MPTKKSTPKQYPPGEGPEAERLRRVVREQKDQEVGKGTPPAPPQGFTLPADAKAARS